MACARQTENEELYVFGNHPHRVFSFLALAERPLYCQEISLFCVEMNSINCVSGNGLEI